jgi:hypothetical protein
MCGESALELQGTVNYESPGKTIARTEHKKHYRTLFRGCFRCVVLVWASSSMTLRYVPSLRRDLATWLIARVFQVCGETWLRVSKLDHVSSDRCAD